MLLSQTQEEQQNWLIYRGHPVLSSQAFRWGVQASKGSLLPCQVFQSKQRQAMHYLSPIGQRQKAFLEGRNLGLLGAGCAAHELCAQSPGEYLALRYRHCLEGHSEILGLGLGVSMGVHICVGGLTSVCFCHCMTCLTDYAGRKKREHLGVTGIIFGLFILVSQVPSDNFPTTQSPLSMNRAATLTGSFLHSVTTMRTSP